MKTRASSVTTIEATAAANIKRAAKNSVEAMRGKSVPAVGLVNNFTPNQKGFITRPMQGYAMLQVGAGAASYGTLAVQGDYKPLPPDDAEQSVKDQANREQLRLRPGYPTLIYPAAVGTSFNTNFVLGGKRSLKRTYPAKALTKAFVVVTGGN